jgi:ABC-type multidrug transport system fused ATPase/permease subunit
LIEATIADDIAFLRPKVTRDDVERAAEAAHVAAEVRELPDGFDTVLGPRGTVLSGGQKQRAAFARALAGKLSGLAQASIERSIQAVFSWTWSRWVTRSAVG